MTSRSHRRRCFTSRPCRNSSRRWHWRCWSPTARFPGTTTSGVTSRSCPISARPSRSGNSPTIRAGSATNGRCCRWPAGAGGGDVIRQADVLDLLSRADRPQLSARQRLRIQQLRLHAARRGRRTRVGPDASRIHRPETVPPAAPYDAHGVQRRSHPAGAEPRLRLRARRLRELSPQHSRLRHRRRHQPVHHSRGPRPLEPQLQDRRGRGAATYSGNWRNRARWTTARASRTRSGWRTGRTAAGARSATAARTPATAASSCASRTRMSRWRCSAIPAQPIRGASRAK